MALIAVKGNKMLSGNQRNDRRELFEAEIDVQLFQNSILSVFLPECVAPENCTLSIIFHFYLLLHILLVTLYMFRTVCMTQNDIIL